MTFITEPSSHLQMEQGVCVCVGCVCVMCVCVFGVCVCLVCVCFVFVCVVCVCVLCLFGDRLYMYSLRHTILPRLSLKSLLFLPSKRYD